MSTLKARRLASADAEIRSMNPCTKCVNVLAREGLTGTDGGCHLLADASLRKSLSENGHPYTMCAYCMRKGEKCFELPMDLESSRVALEKATAAVEGAETSGARILANEALKSAANEVLGDLEPYKAYADHLFAHSGSTDKIGESGVVFAKRARTDADRAKKAAQKRKLAEMGSDEESEAPRTPKKMYGVKGTRETAKERVAREHAELAEAQRAKERELEEARRAKYQKAIKKRSSQRTAAERATIREWEEAHPRST